MAGVTSSSGEPIVVRRPLSIVACGPACWAMLLGQWLGAIAALVVTRTDPTAPGFLKAFPLAIVAGIPLLLVFLEAVGQTRWGGWVHQALFPSLTPSQRQRVVSWSLPVAVTCAGLVTVLIAVDRTATPHRLFLPCLFVGQLGGQVVPALFRRHATPPGRPEPPRLERRLALASLAVLAGCAVIVVAVYPQLHRHAEDLTRNQRCSRAIPVINAAAARGDLAALARAQADCR